MSRIVFITNSIGFGGAEKMLTFVANKLSERGHSCIIVNLNTIGDYINFYHQEINENIKVFTVKQPQKNKNKFVFRTKAIKQIVKENNMDVIIGFTGFPNMYAKIVGSMLHIPSIMSERGDPNCTEVRSAIKTNVSTFIINRSCGGVFQTEGAMKYYGKGLQKRSVVISNPIFINGDVPQVSQFEREKTVVSVGRLDNEQKRYDIMLQAFKIFSEKHSDYILKLYGRGSDEEKIHAWTEELGIADKVLFMGLSTQPTRDIVKDGMFLITSDYEGISNSLLEAMAVGLPCVSTDHTPGGARLLIQDHENGLIVPITNPEKLAAGLCEFAENQELAAKCGENAKNVVNRFEPSKIIDMWEDYIQKLCK